MVSEQGDHSIPIFSGGGSVLSAGLGGEREGLLHSKGLSTGLDRSVTDRSDVIQTTIVDHSQGNFP